MSERYPSTRPRPRTTRCIPTTYRGTRFRSRLESRWAALFDALGWPWEYEPLDLTFYVPDLALTFPAATVIVEVKPETERDALRGYAERIVGAGCEREFLLLGATIWTPHIGILADDSDVRAGGEYILGPAKVFQCIDCGCVSLAHEDVSWRCRVNGCDDGGHVGEIDHEWLARAWAEAGARVQWRPE